MRAFKVGDRVRIGDTEGDVISRDAFVVQLRTIKNVEVTIPNSLVLGSHVINQSAAARGAGLILHTSVTIGYDAPWRRVHELLRAAAAATPGIEADPAPFVLQTALNDYHVSYEINAHTRDAQRSAQLLSALRAAIQDQFNAAGIEILSPAYEARRDGSASTIVPPGA
jgi:small-conductance mechanosensitive channel